MTPQNRALTLILTIGLYLAAFTPHLIASLHIFPTTLTSERPSLWSVEGGTVTGGGGAFLRTVVVVVAVWVTLRFIGSPKLSGVGGRELLYAGGFVPALRAGGGRSFWLRGVGSFLGFFFAYLVGMGMVLPVSAGLLGRELAGGGAYSFDLVSALYVADAGLLEETVLVGFLLAALSAAGVPLGWAVAASVIGRMLFHLYYGPEYIPAFLVWALLVVLVFLMFPNVWGLVAAHTVSNVAALAGVQGAVVLAGAALFCVAVLWAAYRRRGGGLWVQTDVLAGVRQGKAVV